MTKYIGIVSIAIILGALSMMGCSDSSKTLSCPVCNEKPIKSNVAAPGTRLECRNGHSWWLNAPTKNPNR